MHCGIYSLSFSSTDKIYIGMSKEIEYRYKKHLEALNGNRHTNYLLQNEFNKQKEIPKLTIIEECIEKDLPNKEIYYISKFKEVNRVLNLTEGGTGGATSGSGEAHPRSLLSKEDYEEIFKLLGSTKLTQKEISSKLNVSIHIINDIAKGKTHVYLHEKYPELWASINNRIGKHSTVAEKYTQDIYLENRKLNIVVKILNITEFCKEYYIKNRPNISSVINGKRKSAEGWILSNV